MESRGRWLIGTLIALTALVVSVLAWRLPQEPEHRTSRSSEEDRPATEVVAPPHDVPNALIGNWQGLATSAHGTFQMQLNLQQGRIGEYVGSLLIPVAGCRSDVILRGSESTAINVEIQVKTGACVGGNARFALRPNALSYQAMTTDGQSVIGSLQKM